MGMSPKGGPRRAPGGLRRNAAHLSRFPSCSQRRGRGPRRRKRHLRRTVPVAISGRRPYVRIMTRGEPGHSEEHRRLERALEIAGLGEFEWDIARGLFVVSERMAAITGLPAGPMSVAD